MTKPGNLKLFPQGERELVMTRVFDAPRRLVFEAFTRPELVRRWLLGPPGWSMPVCEIDLRVGGRYRYVWLNDSTSAEMGVSGEFREIVPGERIVHTECFDQPWYPGQPLITTVMVEQGGKTTVTMTMFFESREACETVMSSGMERGVAGSYDRLDAILAVLEMAGANRSQ